VRQLRKEGKTTGPKWGSTATSPFHGELFSEKVGNLGKKTGVRPKDPTSIITKCIKKGKFEMGFFSSGRKKPPASADHREKKEEE